MVAREEHQQIKTLLRDTITLLLRNGLAFKAKFSVEALIGVTLDDDNVFLLSINENVKVKEAADEDNQQKASAEVPSDTSSNNVLNQSPSQPTQVKRERTDCRKRSLPLQWTPSGKDVSREESVHSDLGEDQEDSADPGGDDNNTSHFVAVAQQEMPPAKKRQLSSAAGSQPPSDSKDAIVIKHEVVDVDSWQSEYVDDDVSGQGSEADGGPSTSSGNLAAWQDISQTSGLGSPVDAANFAGLIGEQNLGADQQTWADKAGRIVVAATAPAVTVTSLPLPAVPAGAGPRNGSVACPVCCKVVKAKSLPAHLRIHWGHFRYRCNLCDKGFMAKNSLRDHERRHAGQPIPCQHCTKSFYQESQYVEHMKVYHGDQPIDRSHYIYN